MKPWSSEALIATIVVSVCGMFYALLIVIGILRGGSL